MTTNDDRINETIAEVLRLDAEATQGPWHYEPHWGDVYDFTGKPPYRSRRGVTDDFEDGAAIVGARGQDVIYEGTFTAYEQTAGHIGLTEEDHTLIGYYRTAAPVLAREVQRLQAEVQPRIDRSIAFQDAMEEAEAERDEARAEVERLREMRQRGCDCNDEDACRFARERDEARAEVERLKAERDAAYRAGQEAMRERCAALCDDWEEATYCDGWQEMEQGAQHCAEAIRALEVES